MQNKSVKVAIHAVLRLTKHEMEIQMRTANPDTHVSHVYRKSRVGNCLTTVKIGSGFAEINWLLYDFAKVLR